MLMPIVAQRSDPISILMTLEVCGYLNSVLLFQRLTKETQPDFALFASRMRVESQFPKSGALKPKGTGRVRQ